VSSVITDVVKPCWHELHYISNAYLSIICWACFKLVVFVQFAFISTDFAKFDVVDFGEAAIPCQ